MPRQTCANRIVDDVLPLRIITLRTPQLRVPEIALPDRPFMCTRPISRGNAFPVPHLLHQRLSRKYSRCTKKMKVIRHHDITPPNRPRSRLLECLKYDRYGISVREDRLAILAANGQKNDDNLSRTGGCAGLFRRSSIIRQDAHRHC